MNPFSSKPAFIRNEVIDLVPQFQKLTVNFLPAQTRVEMLEDREHTVIPMVMLTEGIHTGSSGPLLYNAAELSKTPEVWNHKPIVVYHPELNGQGISACDPVVVNSRKVGVMMNTSWDAKGKRLKSEAWIEKARAEKIDNRIFAAITKNEMMELSTGLFSDLEKAPGEVNGEAYDGVVRNIRPDHLALLPDKIGACSIAKGAGFLRNETVTTGIAPKEMIKRLTSFFGLTENEMSQSNISDQLRKALQDRFAPKPSDKTSKDAKDAVPVPPMGYYIWIADVYSNFVIFEKDNKLFRLGYTTSDNGITLDGADPVEVKRVTEYRTAKGAFVGNSGQPGETMNKKQMVDAIISNASSGWKETDRERLMAFDDPQVSLHYNAFGRPPVAPGAPAAPAPAAPQQQAPSASATIAVTGPITHPPGSAAPAAAPTANSAPVTLESWLGSAPPEVAGIVRNLLGNEATERVTLIEKIVKNEALGFTKDALATLSIANLRTLGKLADAPKVVAFQPLPNYSGMAPASDSVQNNQPGEEEPLMAPVLNFRKESKTAAAA
jgi:hypothetical protein